MTAAKKRARGRPPAGLGGQPSSKYPQLAVRVPPETIEQCAAIATALELPQWQVVREAIARYHRQAFGKRRRD
jgi:hypothetical protein